MTAPARFHTNLAVERPDPDKEEWVLTKLLAFYSAKCSRMLIVRKGFVTDFASVPRVPVAYWLYANVGQEAAVIHDALYTWGSMPRAVADAIFLEALEACGVSAWRRLPMYWAVRAFGAARYTASQPGLKQDPVSDLDGDALLD